MDEREAKDENQNQDRVEIQIHRARSVTWTRTLLVAWVSRTYVCTCTTILANDRHRYNLYRHRRVCRANGTAAKIRIYYREVIPILFRPRYSWLSSKLINHKANREHRTLYLVITSKIFTSVNKHWFIVLVLPSNVLTSILLDHSIRIARNFQLAKYSWLSFDDQKPHFQCFIRSN